MEVHTAKLCDDGVLQHCHQPKHHTFLLVKPTSDATLDAVWRRNNLKKELDLAMILSNDDYQIIKQIVEWFVLSSVLCVLEFKFKDVSFSVEAVLFDYHWSAYHCIVLQN